MTGERPRPRREPRPDHPVGALALSAAAVLSGLVLATACGAGGAVSGSGASGSPEPSTTAGSPAASARTPQRLALRDDLVDPRVVTFTARPGRGRQVELVFSAGPAECEAARATVREEARQVAIRLEVGRYPGAEQDCVAFAEQSVVTVELGSPRGARPVVPLG